MSTGRFKFRAWDKAYKVMCYPDNRPIDQYSGWMSNPDIFELMQSTGLLIDKYGQEVFEGDIVQIHTSEDSEGFSWGYFAPVVWSSRIAGFRLGEGIEYTKWAGEPETRRTFKGSWNFGTVVADAKDTAVVGNIYENPELLELADDKR